MEMDSAAILLGGPLHRKGRGYPQMLPPQRGSEFREKMDAKEKTTSRWGFGADKHRSGGPDAADQVTITDADTKNDHH